MKKDATQRLLVSGILAGGVVLAEGIGAGPAGEPFPAPGSTPQTSISASIGDYTRPEEYGVILAKDVMVPMRDGVRLATDIYFPARNGLRVEGRFPVLLDRTPYNKVPRVATNNPEFFVKRGYVFVFQDSRGHGNSEGEFYIHLSEGRDGYDTVEWIATQPWSNGDVGTTGYSYDGETQNSLAREAPPHLKAQVLGWTHADYRKEMEGTGNANVLAHNLTYTITHARNDRRARTDPAVDRRLLDARDNIWELFKQPLSKHLELFADVPMARQWYNDWLEHQDYDDYWKQNGYLFDGYYDKSSDVPVLVLGSWYDIFAGVPQYLGLSRASRKSPTWWIQGPWMHGPTAANRTNQGPVDFGTASAVDWDFLRLRFFDEVLRGIKTGFFDEPRVKIFVMGGGDGRKNAAGRLNAGGRWRLEPTYPLPQVKLTNYYFQGNGSLGPDVPDAGSKPAVYSYDPNHPVPFVGGRWTEPRTDGGPQDQRCTPAIRACVAAFAEFAALSSRRDVLVFATPPLERDVEVTGPVAVKLWASSSAVDTDFTAKLVDVYPESKDYPQGFDMLLLESVIRARYRNSLARQELMEPGRIYEFTIDLWAISNLFKAGHRIRVDISSSNWPQYDANPNTGEKVGYHTRTVVAKNTIYRDKEHPSHVILPVVR